MNRKEIGQEIRRNIIDNDKELIIDAYKKLRKSVIEFYLNDIGLQGNYPNLSYKHISNEGISFTYKERSLVIMLKESSYKIIVSKIEPDQETVLDEITAKDNELSCFDGKFQIEEIDEYLSKAFREIL
ncbi:MAG: hypothetical protein ACFWT6_11900 [Virgibacillus proomii]|jgi:hypothetical protein